VDFEIVHTFDADRDLVEQSMFDPELTPHLLKHMSLIREIDLQEITRSPEGIARKVRYVPFPTIRRVGPKEVDPEWMAWFEESFFDRETHRMEYRNVPRVARVAERMEQHGTVRFERIGPHQTRRVVSGVLVVKVPVLGRLAEWAIFRSAWKILEEEATVLRGFLKEKQEAW